MRLRFILIVLLILSVSSAKSYYYNFINVNVTVLSNGDLRVIESESIVFKGSFSYVYRTFYEPVYNFSINGDLTNFSSDGNKYTWRGDWVNTVKTFNLSYVIKDPFVVKEDYDKLWHTVVFKDRSVIVNKAEAHYFFPKPINTSNFRTNRGVINQLSSNELIIKDSNIPPYTALDFEIFLPKGIIEPVMNWKNFKSFYSAQLNILFLSPLIFFIYLTIKGYVNYFSELRKKRKQSIIYQTINVESLPPAIAGLLVDFKVNVKEVTATIIDLAVRGYIYFHKIIKPFWPDKIKLVKVINNFNRLNAFEKRVMNIIFSRSDEVFFSDLKSLFSPSGKLYINTPLYEVIELIKREAVNLGLAGELIGDLIHGKVMLVIKPLIVSLVLSIIHLITCFLIINVESISFLLIMVNFLIIISSIILLSALSSRLIVLTPKGESARLTYLKLKDFINHQPLTDGRLFDTYLPYAIALGVQKKWVKKAEKLNYNSSNSSWHSSNISNFSLIALSYSLNSSISYSSSGSSGGFGGGGGAGGGGGGAG